MNVIIIEISTDGVESDRGKYTAMYCTYTVQIFLVICSKMLHYFQHSSTINSNHMHVNKL